MLKLYTWLKSHSAREEGVTVIEYGVTVGIVSLVLALALAALGGDVFDAVEGAVMDNLP